MDPIIYSPVLVLALLLPSIYGASYTEAGRILPWLVAGGIPWSVTSIALARARVVADSVSIVVMTAFAAVSVLGLAMALVPSRELDGAIAAWCLGNAVASAVAVVLVSVRTRTTEPSIAASTDAAADVTVGVAAGQ